METIRDRLGVGPLLNGGADLWYWGTYPGRRLGIFPCEDDAWGIVALVIEYVERHGYDDQAAIWAALAEWDQARELADLAPEQDARDAALQDHSAAMAAR